MYVNTVFRHMTMCIAPHVKNKNQESLNVNKKRSKALHSIIQKKCIKTRKNMRNRDTTVKQHVKRDFQVIAFFL